MSSSALGNRNYVIYLVGNTVSLHGLWLYRVALGWFADIIASDADSLRDANAFERSTFVKGDAIKERGWQAIQIPTLPWGQSPAGHNLAIALSKSSRPIARLPE